MRHLLSLFDITSDEFHAIQSLADSIKCQWKSGKRESLLENQSLALLFEKPSLRTRISFEAGISQLGGTPIYLSQDVGWQSRESTADFVRVLAEYCDFIVCRAYSHSTVEEIASFNCIPVINGLTDLSHPCQAMADVMTMREIAGDLQGKQLTFVGDGNNVARSVLHACSMAGMKFRLVGPKEYHIDDDWIRQVVEDCPKADVSQTEDPKVGLADADFLYTDVWTSMGQEAEAETRRRVFAPYQVNRELMQHAPKRCRILHCLPAKRGEEITDEVIDSPQSSVIVQAGNRMHLQKGLLVWLSQVNQDG